VAAEERWVKPDSGFASLSGASGKRRFGGLPKKRRRVRGDEAEETMGEVKVMHHDEAIHAGAMRSVNRTRFKLFPAVVLAIVVFVAGCSSGDAPVATLSVDARAVAAELLELADADGDGRLSGDEVAKCGAIAGSKGLFDQDGDGVVTGDELVKRARAWQDARVGLMPYLVRVELDGKPLAGATVRLVPLKSLAASHPVASGETDAVGMASVGIADSELPDDLKSVRGLYAGIYKVEITHPRSSIPARYAAATELTVEVACDAAMSSANVISIRGK
jgi:hypothetical protein